MQELLNCSFTKAKHVSYHLVSTSDLFLHRQGKEYFPQIPDQGSRDSKLIGSKLKRILYVLYQACSLKWLEYSDNESQKNPAPSSKICL